MTYFAKKKRKKENPSYFFFETNTLRNNDFHTHWSNCLKFRLRFIEEEGAFILVGHTVNLQ